MTEPVKVINDTKIRVRDIEVLNKALGIAAAIEFIALMHRELTDYVQISQRLY